MKKSVVSVLCLSLVTSSALAGNVGSVATFPIKVIVGGGGNRGGGMQHDPHAEEQRRRMEHMDNQRRAQEEADRQAQARAHQEWLAEQDRQAAQRDAERMASERAETERQQREQQEQINHEQAQVQEQQRQLDARRQELERQRQEGQINPQAVTTAEVIDAFNHEENPEVKEYWATLIIILQPTNEVAINFLTSVRGWTAEEIAGLNI